MLYIASALAPTPVLFSQAIDNFTSPSTSSLVVARPDWVEVSDITSEGLVYRCGLPVWGNIAGLERATVEGAQPHIVVLIAPPNARLLLIRYNALPTPQLVVTSSIPLTPPTPSLRLAEFFTSVIAKDNAVLVSLWVGVLSCCEIAAVKGKGFTRNDEITSTSGDIREHNLLNLAFISGSDDPAGPMVTFLYQSSTLELLLQPRHLSFTSHSFIDACPPVNLVTPVTSASFETTSTISPDFQAIPFSCPAARQVLPLPSNRESKSLLVIGDEYSVLWEILPPSASVRSKRASVSSGATASPRASDARRSPQAEMTSSVGKKRKSSMGDPPIQPVLRPIWRVRQGFGTVLSAIVLDADRDNAVVLLGDDAGHLTKLTIESAREDLSSKLSAVMKVLKTDLGFAAAPSSLTLLGSSHVFMGSACGDALIIRLPSVTSSHSTPLSPALKSKGKARADDSLDGFGVEHYHETATVEMVERWMNLAPVKDFCAVEEDGGGLSHLVVAAGASNTNSLRAVRSGVSLETLMDIEGVQGIERMWPIMLPSRDQGIFLSTSTSSMLLGLAPEVQALALPESVVNHPTIAAASWEEVAVIVTANNVTVWSDLTGSVKVGSWSHGQSRQILAAQISGGLAAIAISGGELVILQVSAHGVDAILTRQLGGEIASVAILDGLSPIVVTSTWTNEIFLFTLDQLRSPDMQGSTIRENSFCASLQLCPLSGGARLLAGLSDGTMVTYHIESSANNALELSERKAVSLGTQPLRLSPTSLSCGDDRIISVGLSERMCVISESRERIESSSVNRNDTRAAATINTPSHGSCLALATSSGISLVKPTSLKKVHVRTLDLGHRSVSRLTNISPLKAIAAGSTERPFDRETGEIHQSSYVELRDSTTLELLVEKPLESREIVTTIAYVTLGDQNLLAVGIATFSEDDEDLPDDLDMVTISAQSGRLVLYEPVVDQDSAEPNLIELTSVGLESAVNDIKVIKNLLAVATGSNVTIYKHEKASHLLIPTSRFASAFVAKSLVVAPPDKLHPEERLVVGDGMRSIFVLDIDEGTGMIMGDERDMATHSVMAMEGLRDGGQAVIVADAHSNISTFRLREEIETAATFGLHEDISVFRRGSLAPASSAEDVLSPEIIFATIDGRLGIVGELTPSAARTLDDLQRNMDRYIRGPGDIAWRSYRRAGTELVQRDTAGFIDGDFVQTYISSQFSPDMVEKILKGTTAPEHIMRLSEDGTKIPATKAEVMGVLESLSGLH
ncbi:hypothetical protein TREMEDRAFT_71141 [Tremella mesenterica DSM 1558]|uniref:uncharacterized protein n=1 Tax=Tremella mesenterica (strain ATCC 24925 / CBS 8224 / DSM 1558 / NBRC 9311 / NRRL Y-6157 / RJB 2259-6 / UBC 559-6) TaxID=578456 RepID=UPI0003F48F02|nr:uncharacterized protein TREMEDRAFT_71141 [Tremella mesenterica DSM 1558]EIW71360.1 hypothetical protein TREMEDRAFT_71141 [Tremella mesenterica DSM 1558]